jgi:hypothetical protein
MFQLLLEMDKSVFRRGESIPVTLRFENVASEPITLDGVIPKTGSAAGPPFLEIEAPGGRFIRIETGIPRELANDKPVVIEPGQSRLLLLVDLVDVPAWIRTQEGAARGDYGKTINRLGPELRPGNYAISGHFHPLPQRYQGDTDSVLFTIK